MKIILAESAGFCYGVKRAVDLALQAHKSSPAPIQIVGDIVHNEFVMDQLKEAGVKKRKTIDEVKKGTFIIQAHGVSFEVSKKLKQRGLNILDTTCPNVKKVHDIAKQLSDQDYFTVIIGDKNHDEVKGILSAAGKNAIVISNVSEISQLKNKKKIGIVSQTTQSLDNFKDIVEKMGKKCQDLKVFNTICEATLLRQKEVADISSNVDTMIIVGSNKSANTKRLVQIAKSVCKTAHQVNSAEDVKNEWFKDIKKVGISAGASTPDRKIKEVVKKIAAFE